MNPPKIQWSPWPESTDDPVPPPRTYSYIGVTQQGAGIYVRNEAGERRILRLLWPSQITPTVGLSYLRSPWPDNSAPKAIHRTLLKEPECIAADSDPADHLFPIHSPWGRRGPLILKRDAKSDQPELAKRLAEYQQSCRKEYKVAERKLLRQSSKLPKAQLAHQKLQLTDKFTTICPHRSVSGRSAAVSIFDVNIGDVQHGALGIWDGLLRQRFSDTFGIDRSRMEVDQEEFRHWLLGKVALTEAEGNLGSQTLPLDVWQPARSILSYAVRYEIQFTDGNRAWLDHVEETQLQSGQEVAEFEQLDQALRLSPEAPWYAKGFRGIFGIHQPGLGSKTLPLSTALRALCIILNESGGPVSFSTIEQQIGDRIHSLDKEDGQGVMASPPHRRRVRDLLDTKTGKRLLESGVLTLTTMGREKYLELHAPKQAK